MDVEEQFPPEIDTCSHCGEVKRVLLLGEVAICDNCMVNIMTAPLRKPWYE